MTIYFITFFCLFIFAVLEVIDIALPLKRTCLFLSFLIFVIIIGLRWETGTDWIPYLETYQDAKNPAYLLKNSNMEVGYLWSNILINYISNSYSFYLFFHAVIFYGLIFHFFNKVCKFPQTTILVFFGSFMGIVGSNRQLLAVAIITYLLPQIVNNKQFKYIFGVFVSAFFHLTAIITLVYLFFNRNIKSVYLYSIILFAFLLSFTSFITILLEKVGLSGLFIAEKLEFYNTEAAPINAELSLSGLLKRLIFVTTFIYLKDAIRKKNKYYDLMLNGYVFSLTLYFLFGKTLPIIMNRGSLYFNILENVLIAMPMLLFKEKGMKVLFVSCLLILSILMFYQSISLYPDLFDPYKGIFFNKDFTREMH